MEIFGEVYLTRDIPEHGLRKGDIAVWVDSVPAPNERQGEGRVLEVFNAIGDTICTVIVEAEAIAPLNASQVPNARPYQPVQ